MKNINGIPHSRMVEIEETLKREKLCQKKSFLSSAVGSNVLKVTNNNGSGFSMVMPRGDSIIVEGLAARQAENRKE